MQYPGIVLISDDTSCLPFPLLHSFLVSVRRATLKNALHLTVKYAPTRCCVYVSLNLF